MFKRILMAYNGSREGKSALLACRDLAGFTKAETHLLAVATLSSSVFLAEGFHPDQLLEEERARAREILEQGIDQLKERGFTVSGHLAIGDPVEEICSFAAEYKCDLIVVGHSPSVSFLSRWWQGSVGRYLIDHAPCSVLMVLADRETE